MNSFFIVVLALVAAAQANAVYKKLKVEDRIVGGDEAVPHSYPYQAFVLGVTADGKTNRCGGSLLTPTTVLTAAHCVKGYIVIAVFVGAHDLTKNEVTRQRKLVVKFAIHEDYSTVTYVNDIAIVTLDSPVEINEYVQPTLLPTRADVGKTYAGELATVSGWGRISNPVRTFSNVLRFVSGHVLTNEECKKDHSYVTPQQICVDGRSFKVACNGDSGGPLVVGEDRVQVGLVSYGSLAGCEVGSHVVYTRLTEYLDWIAEHGGVEIN